MNAFGMVVTAILIAVCVWALSERSKYWAAVGAYMRGETDEFPEEEGGDSQ